MLNLSPKYISVESRKGGVGKTTIALNMAKTLLNKGYAVLFLDCDITGTSVTKATTESEYWKEYVNIVKSSTDKFLNLLTAISADIDCSELKDKFSSDKINVIGSELYEDSQLVCDPRILMDELHACWLMKQLQEISTCFYEHFSKDYIPSVVIIDNSPGYVGLGRAIDEWLTDTCSSNNHFLLVSSLDNQDVISTVSAAKEIQRLVDGKIRAVRYFYSLANRGLPKDAESKHLDSDPSFKRCFYQQVDTPLEDVENRQLSDYVCILFNKVLDECKDDEFFFDFKSILDESSFDVLIKLYGTTLSSGYVPMMPFDPFIQAQFFNRFLKNTQGDSSEYWEKRFRDLLKNIESILSLNDVVVAAYKIDGYIDRLRRSLVNKGLKRLNINIRETWMPAYCFEDLNNAVDKIAYYIDADIFHRFGNLKKDDIVFNFNILCKRFITDKGLKGFDPVIRSLFGFLIKRAGAGKDKRDSSLLAIVSYFIQVLMNIHYQRFVTGEDYRGFLIQEVNPATRIKYTDYVTKPVQITKDLSVEVSQDTDLIHILHLRMDKFYKTVCYSLLRLKDLSDDSRNLIEILQKLILVAQKRAIPLETRSLLDEYIVRKTLKWNINKVYNSLSKSSDMKEIEKQCQNIIKKWKL